MTDNPHIVGGDYKAGFADGVEYGYASVVSDGYDAVSDMREELEQLREQNKLLRSVLRELSEERGDLRQLCEDYAMEPEQTPGFTGGSALWSTSRAYQHVLHTMDKEGNDDV